MSEGYAFGFGPIEFAIALPLLMLSANAASYYLVRWQLRTGKITPDHERNRWKDAPTGAFLMKPGAYFALNHYEKSSLSG